MMNRRTILKLAALGPAALAAGGFTIEQQPSPWPKHMVESSDPLWPTLNSAAIEYEPERGILKATFPDAIRRLNGVRFSISGFYWPIGTAMNAPHFLLTRRNQSCPFCPGNEITEAVEILARHAFAFTREPITATGQFVLVNESIDGFFFQLRDATVALQ